jgi:hypothetical protein
MIIDKYTKAILTLIAISLFVISLNPWIAPTKAYAELDRGDLDDINISISGIKSVLKNISQGVCLNSKIC